MDKLNGKDEKNYFYGVAENELPKIFKEFFIALKCDENLKNFLNSNNNSVEILNYEFKDEKTNKYCSISISLEKDKNNYVKINIKQNEIADKSAVEKIKIEKQIYCLKDELLKNLNKIYPNNIFKQDKKTIFDMFSYKIQNNNILENFLNDSETDSIEILNYKFKDEKTNKYCSISISLEKDENNYVKINIKQK